MKPRFLRKPPMPLIRLFSAQRALYWRLSGMFPILLLAEFPRSGGTWIAQMVAEAAGYRFPRNALPPSCWRTVLMGHRLYHPSYRKVGVVFRDGRDVMVSAYHHFLFSNEWNNDGHVRHVRKRLGLRDSDGPYAKFNLFLEWMFAEYPKRMARFSWSEFVQSWHEREVPKVYYEAMIKDPAGEIRKLCAGLGVEVGPEKLAEIVEQNSFERQTGRRRGDAAPVGRFARKGVAGDWRNVFDGESRQIFDHYAGTELVTLGYERDRNWVGASP